MRLALVALVPLTVLAVAGCGSSTPKPDPAREARLVAELKALCRARAHRSEREVEHGQGEGQAQFATVERALKRAAAYLPAGRALNEADAKRRALEDELSGHGHPGRSSQPAFIERFWRIELQVYESVKALGLGSCQGPRPRAPIGG